MINKHFCPFCGGRLLTKFLEGRSRLFCKDCCRPIYENPIPATAAVIINEKNEVLLIKRNVEPKIGKWCLPGGFIELEEKPDESCLRELKEETNLEGDIEELAGVYLSGNPIYKSVIIIGYSIKNVRGTTKAGDDSEEVGFFKLEERPRLAFKSHESILKNVIKKKRIGFFSKFKNIKSFGAYVITSKNHLDITKKACNAGAKILQYRDKTSNRKKLLSNALKISEITKKYNTLFIVNDFIDIALMSNADGVHLGQGDIDILETKKIVPEHFIIGVSTHSLAQAIEAEKMGADYIGIGPVYATPTKENYPPIGMNIIKKVFDAVKIPVVAIGGLNLGNISELFKVGIKNFAMVRGFQKNTEEVVKTINKKR